MKNALRNLSDQLKRNILGDQYSLLPNTCCWPISASPFQVNGDTRIKGTCLIKVSTVYLS